MTEVSEFTVGEIYTNDQIRFTLGLENLGGIRPSIDSKRQLRHLAILTAAEDSGKVSIENPYVDRIEQDILVYTAQGREGDQELVGRNRRLLDQYSDPAPYFGFINIGKQTYRFLGLLELLRHYQEVQSDRRGNARRVWIFEFRIHTSPHTVPVSEARSLSASLICRQDVPSMQLEDREISVIEGGDPISARIPPLEREEIRSRLLALNPSKFEHVVAELMNREGFGQVAVTRRSGDGGIDVDAYVQDTSPFFGGRHVQVQVKRWRHAVGIGEINGFRGALSSTAHGVFVTTSSFTKAAVAESRHPVKPCISLIDGYRLSELVFDKSLDLAAFQ